MNVDIIRVHFLHLVLIALTNWIVPVSIQVTVSRIFDSWKQYLTTTPSQAQALETSADMYTISKWFWFLQSGGSSPERWPGVPCSAAEGLYYFRLRWFGKGPPCSSKLWLWWMHEPAAAGQGHAWYSWPEWQHAHHHCRQEGTSTDCEPADQVSCQAGHCIALQWKGKSYFKGTAWVRVQS